MQSINVVKRDGRKETLDIAKIQKQVALACEGISGVSPSTIELTAQLQFHDGITSADIDKTLLRAMINLIDPTQSDVGHVNYQYVAGRHRVAMLRKEVYGRYTPPRLYDIVKANIAVGLYTPELLEWYTEAEWDKLDAYLDHSKDENYTYAAIDQLIEKYLVRNRATGKVYETPQIRYMVAAATAFHMEPTNRLRYVKEYYKYASDGAFTLATPVLAGLGTPQKQFSSCVLISTDDTLKSIFASGEMMANYASARAGIGLEVGKMRRLKAPIRNGQVAHTGYIPFLKKWFGDLRSCSQGGIRNASCTVWFPIWHHSFDDLIVLKNNQGTEETRVRHLDYGVVLSSFFWRRFKKKQDITFFDPHEVPDLYDAFYSDTAEFERLYCEYEKRTDLAMKRIPAETVFKDWLLKERTDTGRIYLMNVDNVIRQTPFDVKTDPIVQSNLCAEILLSSKPFQRLEDEAGRIALCTLGSSNWGYFKIPQAMRDALYILVRALSNVLSYQDFLSVQSALSNKEFMPLGVGVTNLAYWHAKRGYEYGQPEALAEVKEWMEWQTYFLLDATVRLAEERGKCGKSDTLKYAQGILPQDNRAPGVDELTDFTPNPDIDWADLRARMRLWGVHNATVGAVAPVESSSVCINSTNGIALPQHLIADKESKAGTFTQVVPEFLKYKDEYEKLLMWEQKDCVGYLKTAAVLTAFLDQSISADTFYSPKHFPDGKVPATLIAKNLMLYAYWGGKTNYYSLMEKNGAKEALNDNEEPLEVSEDDHGEDYCEACVL